MGGSSCRLLSVTILDVSRGAWREQRKEQLLWADIGDCLVLPEVLISSFLPYLQYGVCIMWNLNVQQEADILQLLKPCKRKPLRDSEVSA